MTAYSNPRTTERNIKDRAVRQRRKPMGDYPAIPAGLGLQYDGIGKYSLWLYRNDQNQIEVVTARFIDVPAGTAKLSIQARPDSQEWAVTMEGREVGRYPFSMPVQASSSEQASGTGALAEAGHTISAVPSAEHTGT